MSFIKQYVLIFSVCILLVMLLTGCVEFEAKIGEIQSQQYHEETEQLCCIPDPDFPHSCDGWLLCEPGKAIDGLGE